MPTPFPGMDPYLEHPAIWPDVHNSLITALRNDLAPKLRPRYYLAIEERLYLAETEAPPTLAGRADVALVSGAHSAPSPTAVAAAENSAVVTVELPMPDQIRETFLEVRQPSHQVVTVIEILSPTNKRPGLGRNLYQQKRLGLLGTQTHLVEIDLLRAWDPMPMWGPADPAHYRLLISRAERRPMADLLPFTIRQPIPSFALPLRDGDQEPRIDLGRLLHALYEQAGYDLRLDYRAEPEPSLADDDAAWIDDLLRQGHWRA